MSFIKTTNITKKFGNNVVFKNLNFSVEKGECVTITGPSGQGKSTFLRCLAGLEEIDSGTIEIAGNKLVENGVYTCKKDRCKILSKLGMVFQNFNLFCNLTIRQNLEIISKKRECKDKIDVLLEQFGIKDKQNLYPKNLSGGQKQRVAIARALMLDPEIILFDEPTSALDEQNKLQIVKIIEKLQAISCTTIIVTHDLQLVSLLNSKNFSIKY